MTDDEEPQMSSDEAVNRSWWRLRRAHIHKETNPEARQWREMNEHNHFGPSLKKEIQAAMLKAAMRGRET